MISYDCIKELMVNTPDSFTPNWSGSDAKFFGTFVSKINRNENTFHFFICAFPLIKIRVFIVQRIASSAI